jgi:hypothetical protein
MQRGAMSPFPRSLLRAPVAQGAHEALRRWTAASTIQAHWRARTNATRDIGDAAVAELRADFEMDEVEAGRKKLLESELTVHYHPLPTKAGFPEALDAVPAPVRDAATAVGYSRIGQLMKVELPLSIPVLTAGLRVVAVTNISMVAVGSVIGIGGLGIWFTDGYQSDKSDQIVAGIIAVFILAIIVDVLILLAGRFLAPWARVQSGDRPMKVAAT